jgi:hypothetical protein
MKWANALVCLGLALGAVYPVFSGLLAGKNELKQESPIMNRLIRFCLLIATVNLLISLTTFAATSGGTCANFAGGSCPPGVPNSVTSFYFIDYSSGSDANSGTSESTPWQHAPGMANATGNAAKHTPTAGEGWIFKGGVTVDFNAWPANVPWGGTAAATDYMGPDPGWYAGKSWSRPVFDGGGKSGYNAAKQSLLTDVANNANYVVIDDIEFNNLYWSGDVSSGASNSIAGYIGIHNYSAPQNWEVKNVYAHGWTHCTPYGSNCTDPANSNGALIFIGLPSGTSTSSIHDSVVDGSDSQGGGDSQQAFHAPYVYRNWSQYIPNNYQGTYLELHDNVITHNTNSFDSNIHMNCIHVFGTASSTPYLIYNNYVDCQYASPSYGATSIDLEDDNTVHYVFNNVIKAGNGQGITDSYFISSVPGSQYNLFNNTIETEDSPSPGASCYTLVQSTVNTLVDNFCVTNNYFSTAATPSLNLSSFVGSYTAPSPTFTTNCKLGGGAQTNFGSSQICNPIGSGDGTGNLNDKEQYPLAPMDATAAATIGTGQNNTSFCNKVSAVDPTAGPACLSDTTLGVSYDTSDHTVSGPARTPLLRPTSGGWEIGAYQPPSGQPPNAPTGLTASVN